MDQYLSGNLFANRLKQCKFISSLLFGIKFWWPVFMSRDKNLVPPYYTWELVSSFIFLLGWIDCQVQLITTLSKLYIIVIDIKDCNLIIRNCFGDCKIFQLMKYCSRSTEEIFALFISIAFTVDSIKFLVHEFEINFCFDPAVNIPGLKIILLNIFLINLL